MTPTEAKNRIEELRRILSESNRLYYVENAPTMSDYEYDQLMYELIDLEKKYPQFQSPTSPTQRVGSDIATKNEFKQYPHKYPMLSLENTYSMGDVEDFVNRAKRSVNKDFSFSCELKFDGTAICLTYINGELKRALTRGDGVVGDDVIQNVKKIKSIPTKLKGNDYPNEFEIRGEIFMSYASFDKLNKEREENEESLFANPRNAASGSLKLLDPKEVANRGLDCTLYHILGENLPFQTHSQALDKAKEWGLPISDKRSICKSVAEVEKFIEKWDVDRKTLPFPTDGIVIKINELQLQKDLGYTSKFPRWAVAYKFKAEQALTKLYSIDYQVGRTGAITPVANLEPVLLSGTVVKRASLHNFDIIKNLGIKIGDFVYVEKGGEIIPKITGIELSQRPEDCQEVKFPIVCPDCGTKLVNHDGETKFFCPNIDGCPTQIKGRLLHFVTRKAMNILAGDATIEQLYDLKLVRNLSDYYKLSKDDLLRLDGWKTKMANNFLNSIEKSKSQPFEKVLFALGIRNIGEVTAKHIARHFKNIDNLIAASYSQLTEINDVGDIIAQSILDYFSKQEHLDEIQNLKQSGINFSIKDDTNPKSSILDGLNIVITGNFTISRNDMKKLIEDNGGKNTSSVTSKTSYLLLGEKYGPEKIKKAEALGIKIIHEDDFYKMIGKDLNPVSNNIIDNELDNKDTKDNFENQYSLFDI